MREADIRRTQCFFSGYFFLSQPLVLHSSSVLLVDFLENCDTKLTEFAEICHNQSSL